MADSFVSVRAGAVVSTDVPVVTGRSGAVSYAISSSSTVNESALSAIGLSLNKSNGVISGTVTSYASPGAQQVTLEATDGVDGETTTFVVGIVITGAPLTVTDTSIMVTQGGSVLSTPIVTGQIGSMSYAIDDSSAVDASVVSGLGLALNSSTGVISGTVGANATPGHYVVKVRATDSLDSASTTFLVAVTITNAPLMATGSSISVTQGGSMTTTAPVVTGQSGVVSYAIDDSSAVSTSDLSNLGLSLNSSTGVISGTVGVNATPGLHTVKVRVTDVGDGDVATFTVTISVSGIPLTVTDSSKTVVEDSWFTTDAPVVSGKSGAIAYSIVEPTSQSNWEDLGAQDLSALGLSFNGSSGVISGRVQLGSGSQGTWVVTVKASDSVDGQTATFTITIT